MIEEIARHVGYERLGRTVPKSVVAGRLSPIQARRRLLRQVLYGLGISEAMPNPFLAPGDLDRAGLDARGLTIANPLVAEESVLRTSLRPGLFKAVAYNASHRYDDVALFEIGRTYAPAEGPLPDEREVLGVALAGREGPAAVPVLQEVVAALGLGDRMQLAAAGLDAEGALAGMHPGRSSVVTVDGRPVGVVGEVDPGVLEAYGIPGRVAWLELDLTVLLGPGAGDPAVGARQPLPVERHRPGLRRRRRRHRRRPPRRHRRCRRRPAGRPRPVRRLPRTGDPGRPTQPGLPHPPAGGRPHADGCRGGRRPRRHHRRGRREGRSLRRRHLAGRPARRRTQRAGIAERSE